MTESIKATRASVPIGSLLVDGFMLPDGSYRMSLTQTAESVGKPARSTFDFLRSKALKRLLDEAGSTFDRNSVLERALTELGEAFAIEDDIRRERDYFERRLRENGIDPWGLPGTEDTHQGSKE